MKCPLCSVDGAACGHPYIGTPTDLPERGTTAMAQGPLVRVDTLGNGKQLIKMGRKDAEAWVASHPGSSIQGDPRVVSEGVVEQEAPAPDKADAQGAAQAAAKHPATNGPAGAAPDPQDEPKSPTPIHKSPAPKKG